MRILLSADPMIPVPPVGYGGIERIVDSLVRDYRDRGHQVGLVAHPRSTCPAQVRFGWPGLRLGSVVDTWRNLLCLRRAVREFQPDVVHSFSRLAYLAGILPTPVPKVMSYQRHTGGKQVALAARLGGRRLRFTGCSEFICRMGRPSGGRWTAVPNFVDPRKFKFVPHLAQPGAPLVFLSRIERIKGPDTAIAIALAAGRRLILAGNRAETGPERDFWDREIAPHLGRDGIEWVGEVDDSRKDALLGSAAGMLLPIRWDEPFGIVIVEAFAAGTPVIACPRGAVPEIVEPGKTGFLIASVEDGVQAVRSLPNLARGDCRRAAERLYSVRVCADSYLRIYGELGA